MAPPSPTNRSRRSEPTTLADVASRAGVDPSTASRVLNDKPIRIRSETRALIERLAQELGYHPSSAARGLRRRESGALGLLIPDFENPVYATIIRAASARAEELGYAMLMAELPAVDHDSVGPAFKRLVHERRIDGLIVATARNSDALLRELKRVHTPHVLAHRRTPQAQCSVILDDEGAAALAAQYLASRGHTRLGVVIGPAGVDTARRRLLGFRRACRALGLPRPAVESQAFTAQGGYAGMSKLLALTRRPTAVFVSNLLAAVGALAALHEAGVDVPGEVSLVAYDDAAFARYTIPALTTIAVPYDELGSVSVDVLDAVLRGEKPGNIMVETPARVIERSSVASRLA